MGEHHSLGWARGATGVEEAGQIVLGHVVEVGEIADRVGGRDQRLVAIGHPDDAVDEFLDPGGWAVGDERADTGISEDVGDLRVGQAGVDRHDDETRRGDSDVGLHVGEPVGHQQGDAVPARQAEPCQRAGEGSTAIVEFAETDR